LDFDHGTVGPFRYRKVMIQAGRQTLTAAEPPPDDLAEALAKIHLATDAH
jgi:hypothetical protein